MSNSIQPTLIDLEQIALLPPEEQDKDNVEIVSSEVMKNYAELGIKRSGLEIVNKKMVEIGIPSCGLATGSSMMSIGFCGLGHTLTSLSCTGLYSISLIAFFFAKGIRHAGLKELKEIDTKLSPLFDATGQLKRIETKEGKTFTHIAIHCWKRLKDETFLNTKKKIVYRWCEFLIEKGLPLNPVDLRDNPLFNAALFDCLPLARLFASKGAGHQFLSSEAWIVKHRLKSNLEEWEVLLPGLKELGKLQMSIKILSHAFEVDFDTQNNERLAHFDGFGFSHKMAAHKILKIFSKTPEILKNECFSLDIQNHIESALKGLINETYHLEDKNSPLLIDIGYKKSLENAGHSIYLFILNDKFVYADTGTNSSYSVFGVSAPVCFGEFERSRLTQELFDELLSLCQSVKEEHSIKIKELLCDKLGLHQGRIYSSSLGWQKKGICAWRGLVACLSALPALLTKLDLPLDYSATNTSLIKTYLFFDYFPPLSYLNRGKWLAHESLVKDPKFLPAWQEIKAKFTGDDLMPILIKNFCQCIRKEAVITAMETEINSALDTLSAIIQNLEELNDAKKPHKLYDFAEGE